MRYFVFSIDVEDWFQVENLKERIGYGSWSGKESRVEKSAGTVLDVLRRKGIRATFFILGWIAERNPQLVRRIASQGHEIASHGYKHELLHTIEDTGVESDIKKSIEILSPLSPNRIIGYRAPSFSITRSAVRILKEMNFLYDASLNDFQFNKRYGKLTARERLCGIDHRNVKHRVLDNGLIEFPISVNTYFNVYWPLGGGYFRMSPMWFIRKQLRDSFREGDIVSIYLHPWEFDPAQPRVRGLSADYYFRHYCGLGGTAHKFERLIDSVRRTPGVEITTFGAIARRLSSFRVD